MEAIPNWFEKSCGNLLLVKWELLLYSANSAQLTQNQRLSHPRDCHEISILILSEFKQLTSSNPPEIKRKPMVFWWF